jgi:hypothetical protein
LPDWSEVGIDVRNLDESKRSGSSRSAYGYIVYQGTTDRVHYLNKTAAIVFEFCDGRLEADGIVARVARAFELSDSVYPDIRACMDSLVKEGLVQSNSK